VFACVCFGALVWLSVSFLSCLGFVSLCRLCLDPVRALQSIAASNGVMRVLLAHPMVFVPDVHERSQYLPFSEATHRVLS